MDNVTLQSFGAAAGALIVVYWGFQSAPSLIGAIKGDKSTPREAAVKEPAEEFKEVINNNTLATTKLTQFLEKDAAVREVKDGQVSARLDSIDKKLDNIYDIVNTHSTKCDATCRNAG
ncbi:MAG: hypothetical protein AB6733_18695 [Clostridiaceae bacterium]